MAKQYTRPEVEPTMANEPVMEYSRNIGVADALWALISAQTQEVQDVIAERINALKSKKATASVAYHQYHTREAISSRLDDFEQMMKDGNIQWIAEDEVESWINGLA